MSYCENSKTSTLSTAISDERRIKNWKIRRSHTDISDIGKKKNRKCLGCELPKETLEKNKNWKKHTLSTVKRDIRFLLALMAVTNLYVFRFLGFLTAVRSVHRIDIFQFSELLMSLMAVRYSCVLENWRVV